METVIDEKVSAFPWLENADQFTRVNGRPWVTLSYAQSLDGSIASNPGQRTPISSSESMLLTHQLRAAHDAILAGIGTVLADDPLLNVRIVSGGNPQPVILDSALRIPLTSQLLQRLDRKPWIACSSEADPTRAAALIHSGARLFPIPPYKSGGLDLVTLLEVLATEGICSMMVEGGAEVITSFLTRRLVDWAVITVAPIWLGGLRPLVNPVNGGMPLVKIDDPLIQQMGQDLIVSGKVAA